MRTLAVALLLLGAGSPLAAGSIEIRPAGDRLSLTCTATPLSEVLDRLARQTGMKVVYDGAPPRNMIATSLQGVTAAQAVVGVLEGLGLNYAMVLDRDGSRVDTLMMVGVGAVAPGRPLPAASIPEPASQAVSEPEVVEEDVEEEIQAAMDAQEAQESPEADAGPVPSSPPAPFPGAPGSPVPPGVGPMPALDEKGRPIGYEPPPPPPETAPTQ